MYFVESEPVIQNPAEEFDNFSSLTTRLIDADVEPAEDHRFFFETPGWIEGNDDGITLHVTIPGVTRDRLEVYVINNIIAMRGRVPLKGMPKGIESLSELLLDEGKVPEGEYCRAVRLPMAILGETLEVDVNDEGEVNVTAKWDPTSERHSPPSRIPKEYLAGADE